MKRKHPVETEIFQCDVCDFETKKKIELKRHIKSHSYKYDDGKMKCNECDFIGQNAWTLQIHIGKEHNQPIDCGLCDFPAKDLETLNLHLKTCEIYECNNCEHVSKSISSIKKHIHNKQECKETTIHHVKIARNNDEEADATEYEQSELK